MILNKFKRYNNTNKHVIVNDEYTIYIVVGNHCIISGKILESYFKKKGISCIIVNLQFTSLPASILYNVYNNKNHFLFLIGILHIGNLENLNIITNKCSVLQIEQLNMIDDLTKTKIINFISKCNKVYDYTYNNIFYYEKYNKEIYEKIKFFTPLINPNLSFNNNKMYDIIFIGTVNERRNAILKKLNNNGYSTTIINNSWGNNLLNIIKQSKIVINLHYNEKYNSLEIFRLHEIIPYDTHIISETISTDKEEELIIKYKNLISFIPIIKENNIEYLINMIDNIKNIPVNRNLDDINKINNNSINILSDITNNAYPTLFHKLILNIHKQDDLQYKVITKETLNSKNLIAHLHCYNGDQFDKIYHNYIKNIEKYFNIYITYCIGSIDSKYTHIKIPNKGFDIGAKICLINYLKINKIKYSHILFLHSKSCELSREKYFNFIKDSNIEECIKKINENYDGIFPAIKKEGDWNTKKFWPNKIYFKELCKYLNIDNKNHIFFEGNCMILSYRICKHIFEDNDYLFYSILNDSNSFDINWVKWYYKINGTIETIYKQFKDNNLYGNTLACDKTTEIPIHEKTTEWILKSPFTDYRFADGQFEHAFERIYLNCIITYSGKATYL
tara:strand:+ start:7078 stop:8931 length:1854 start_codon:yes stop_codon:yes gene_type:complete